MKRRTAFPDLDGNGKLPPQEVELEEAVLGALLIEPDSYAIIEEIIQESSFYKEQNALVFNAISEIRKAKEKVDILTVTAHLKKNGKLDIVGGAFRIAQLTEKIVSSANIEYHARIIAEAYLAREVIRIASSYVNRSFDNSEDIFDMIDEMHKEITLIKDFGIDSNSDVPLQASIDQRVKEKKDMISRGARITGISTGDDRLDNIISGFNNGSVYVFAGAAAMGKSVKGMNYANIVAQQGYTVPFFSLEMPKHDLIDRLIVEESKIPLHDYRANRMTHLDIQKMESAARELKKLPIVIYDDPSATPNFIRRKLKVLLKRECRIGLVIIDYAQLLKPDSKASSREQEVSNSVKELKVIAKEFNVPILLLAQVGRGIYQIADRRPNLSHLRESAEIENSADFVAFIYRPSYYFDREKHPDFNDESSKISKCDQIEYERLSEIIVMKNRAGVPNVVLIENFYGQYSCFTKDPISYNSDVFMEDEAPNSDLIPF